MNQKSAQELKEQIGSQIRQIRLSSGWTQQGLAAELQAAGFSRCSRSFLAKIESGEAALRCHEIFYFRQVFGMSFEKDFWKSYDGDRRQELPPGKRF